MLARSCYDSNIILDFNLDFYTEVQDLSYLENSLSASLPPRFTALNMAMISLVEDYSLVGFETLAVEVRYYIAYYQTLTFTVKPGQKLDAPSY